MFSIIISKNKNYILLKSRIGNLKNLIIKIHKHILLVKDITEFNNKKK